MGQPHAGPPRARAHTGVETTTGPLGQGIGNAVGMAMAARRERGLLDPDAAVGASPFDHHIYAFMSDGDIEEGISHEASSLAGHQQLGNLIVLYDDNNISIEDDTNIAKSEDVVRPVRGVRLARAAGELADAGRLPRGRAGALRRLLAARANTAAPSLIALRTIIGWPAPNKQNTGAAHGSALGAAEVAATKEVLGFDPAVSFPAEEEAVAHARKVGDRGKQAHAAGTSGSRPGRPPIRSSVPCSTGWPGASCRTAGAACCPRSRPMRRGWPPGRRPARS